MQRELIVSGLIAVVLLSSLMGPPSGVTAQEPPPDDAVAGTRLYLPLQARFAAPRGNFPPPTRTPAPPVSPGPSPTGMPTPTPGGSPAPGPVTSPFGVAMFDGVNASSGLPHMANAGADWIMTNIRWVDIEPVEGQPYDFSSADAKIDSIAAAGMRTFALFDHLPDWAAIAPGAFRAPTRPEKAEAMLRVIRALVERYNGRNGHGQVDYWMFIGEPDHIAAWGERPEDYADMLATVAPQVRAVHPGAKVMIGALAYDWFTTDPSRGPFRRDFLGRVLNRLNTKPGGASAYLDAITFNYFDISGWRWPTIFEKTAEIRGIMATHQVANLPVIITEMGRSSRTGGREDTSAQARWLVHSYVRGLSIGVSQMHWFQVFDMEPATYEKDYGLFVRSNLSQPKPAYVAYATLAAELDQAVYERRLDSRGLEAYVFRQGNESKIVAWGSAANAVDLAVARTCARVVGRQGEVSIFTDGGLGDRDGQANGAILIVVQPAEPVYIGTCS